MPPVQFQRNVRVVSPKSPATAPPALRTRRRITGADLHHFRTLLLSPRPSKIKVRINGPWVVGFYYPLVLTHVANWKITILTKSIISSHFPASYVELPEATPAIFSVGGQRGPKLGFPTLRCDAPEGGWRCDAATLRRSGGQVALRRCDAATLPGVGDAVTLRRCDAAVGPVTLRRCQRC